MADPAGDVTHRGQNYTTLDRSWTISFTPELANFAGGDVAGLVMRLEITAIAGTYDAWAASVFPEQVPYEDRLPDASPFGDGIPNLLAYALALDPLANKSAGLPTAEPADGHLIFRFRRNTNASDLSIVVESSDDLGLWTDVLATPTVMDPDADGDGNAAMLEISIPMEPEETKRFARLRVSFTG